MSIAWFISLSVASIMFLTFYFVASCLTYKNRFKNKYDVRNYFPYEFNYQSPFNENLLGNIALIMGCALSSALFSLSAYRLNANGYLIYALVSGTIYSIIIGVINFIPLRNMKVHLVFAVLLFAAAFITPLSIGLGGFSLYQISSDIFPLVIFIVSVVIGVFYFGVAMNPKLTLNIKMQIATDEKGNEIYLRPKYIVIAFSEWLSIFGIVLSHVLLILLMSIVL